MNRVWIVDEFGHGGIGRYAVDVANLIGHAAPTVVATSALGPVDGLRGRSVEWFPRLPGGAAGRGLGGAVGLLRALWTVRRDDVAWIPLGIRPLFELALVYVMRARKARVVVTVHNRGPHGRGESRVVVRAARSAAAVVVHTDALATWANDHRLAAVRLPFPPPDLRGDLDGTVTRASIGVPPHSVLLSLLGYLHEYKGVDVLVQALALARREAPDLGVHVLLAGRLPEHGAVPKALRDAADFEHLTVRAGWLEESELACLLALSDAVALPYREIDNSGIGALARSRGVPALASDLPGLREIFGDAAYYTAPGDVEGLAAALVRLPTVLPGLKAQAAVPSSVGLAATYRAFIRQLTAAASPR